MRTTVKSCLKRLSPLFSKQPFIRYIDMLLCKSIAAYFLLNRYVHNRYVKGHHKM